MQIQIDPVTKPKPKSAVKMNTDYSPKQVPNKTE